MSESRFSAARTWIGSAVFLYGTVVALTFAFGFYGRQDVIDTTVDLNGFGTIARSLAKGEGFSSGYGPTTRRAPLYPYFGGALLSAFGDDTPGRSERQVFTPLIVANCVILGLTCLVVWVLARRLFDDRVALVAALICPIMPQSLRYVGMTEVETMMALWIALLALTSHALVLTPRASTGLAFGLVAAAATLTKPVAMLYPLGLLPLAALHWRSARTGWRPAVLCAGVALVTFVALLLPWSLRNRALTNGQFSAISSNAPGEFLRGYINAQPKYFLLRQDFGGSSPGEKWDPEANLYEQNLLAQHGVTSYRTLRRDDGTLYLHPSPPAGVTAAMIEVEKDRIEGAEMKRRLLHEPGQFLRKFAVQLITFWYIVETRFKSLLVGSMAIVMLTLSALGVWRAYRLGATVWPVLLVLLYFNAFYAAFLAFARYSMPLFPTLSLLAGAGVVWLVTAVQSRWTGQDAGHLATAGGRTI